MVEGSGERGKGGEREREREGNGKKRGERSEDSGRREGGWVREIVKSTTKQKFC